VRIGWHLVLARKRSTSSPGAPLGLHLWSKIVLTMRKEPLFRKVNTRARGVHHHFGKDYRHERNTKREKEAKDSEVTHGSMHGRKNRGLDYTPLFRFLLSKVGGIWDEIYSEAVSRLDRPEPIFWLVALQEHERKEYVCLGESTYFRGLYVDEDGRLRLVNPDLIPEQVTVYCQCCTHTLDGKPIPKRSSSH
jgi:hypothetical protein